MVFMDQHLLVRLNVPLCCFFPFHLSPSLSRLFCHLFGQCWLIRDQTTCTKVNYLSSGTTLMGAITTPDNTAAAPSDTVHASTSLKQSVTVRRVACMTPGRTWLQFELSLLKRINTKLVYDSLFFLHKAQFFMKATQRDIIKRPISWWPKRKKKLNDWVKEVCSAERNVRVLERME